MRRITGQSSRIRRSLQRAAVRCFLTNNPAAYTYPGCRPGRLPLRPFYSDHGAFMKITHVFIPLLATLPLRDAGLPLRLDALQTSSYEVIVRMQGKDIGGQKFAIQRMADGFVLTEETTTPFGGQ